MSEWQPIETAPKDGTRVLTLWPVHDVESNLPVPDAEPLILISFNLDGSWDEPSEVESVGDYFGDDHEYGWPTHWMPLPEPPKAIP